MTAEEGLGWAAWVVVDWVIVEVGVDWAPWVVVVWVNV